MSRPIPFDTQALLRACRIFLLPLLLLLAQQGAFLHELDHYAAHGTQHQSDQHDSHDKSCERCMAFAQIGTAVAPGYASPGLLADLAPEQALPAPVPDGTTEVTAPQSRGPPITL